MLEISIQDDIKARIVAYAKTIEGMAALRVVITVEGELVLSSRKLPTSLGKIALCERSMLGAFSWIKYSDRESWDEEKSKQNAQHLLFYSDAEVLEFSEANVFFWQDDKLRTPSCDGRFLPGVSRAAVLHIASRLGIDVVEQSCPLSWFAEGRPCFFSSSLRGIIPVEESNARWVESIQERFWDSRWMAREERMMLERFRNSFAEISGAVLPF